MQVVISRHPSLEEMRYINDISSVLVIPPLSREEIEEHIYQELIRVNHSANHIDIDIDENKENRPPLMPIKCPTSRIPVWTPSPTPLKPTQTLMTTQRKKNSMDIIKTPKMTPKSKPNLTGKSSFSFSLVFPINHVLNGRSVEDLMMIFDLLVKDMSNRFIESKDLD